MVKEKNKSKKRKRYAGEFIRQVANNIRHYRMKERYSQEELQEKTGIKISRCETGKYDMTLTTIAILSKELKIEPSELVK